MLLPIWLVLQAVQVALLLFGNSQLEMWACTGENAPTHSRKVPSVNVLPSSCMQGTALSVGPDQPSLVLPDPASCALSAAPVCRGLNPTPHMNCGTKPGSFVVTCCPLAPHTAGGLSTVREHSRS